MGEAVEVEVGVAVGAGVDEPVTAGVRVGRGGEVGVGVAPRLHATRDAASNKDARNVIFLFRSVPLC
jgi:hypothetical protein